MAKQRLLKGTQRYRCYACQKSFLRDYSYLAYKPEVKTKILEMAVNGSGVRDTARTLKISQNTVSSHIKKSDSIVFVNPEYAFQKKELFVKVDEMWSFVGKKKTQNWLWWVEDALNGHIVAFTFGRRTNETFTRLKNLLMNAGIHVDLWITDFWIAYQDCLDPNERMENKGALQSLERKHLTLRTRIKRLTRKTICFSKSTIIHNTLIGLFINSFFFKINQHV